MALSADERCNIEEELVKTKATASGVVEAISVVNDVMAQLRDQSYETMSEVRSAADKLILEVRSHEEKLIEKVVEILEWKEACLRKQKKSLEDFLAELQQSIDYTSDVLNKPENQDIDEWKAALTTQLQSLQNMKDDYVSKPEIDDGSGFLFLYNNDQLLKSIACYGSIVNNVKEAITYGRKEGEGMSGIQVIPVITLNGLVVDLVEEEKKKSEDTDLESSDDEDESDDDDDDDDDESGSEESDDEDIDDEDTQHKKGHKTIGDNDKNYKAVKDKGQLDDDCKKYSQKNTADKKRGENVVNNPQTIKSPKLSTLL